MKYNFSESLFKKKFARSALLGDRCERHLGYQNDPGIKVVGDYIVGARFAQGKACKVKEGISLLTGERVVIKIIKIISINKKSDKVSMAIKEIKNYSAVNNINVVKLRSAYVKIEHCDYVSSLNMEGDLNFAPAEICPIVGDLSILKCIQQKISKIYMVFEFCICNLEEYIAHSPNQIIEEKLCKSYFIQILNGLNGIHSMNIIHADIKPSNIFLTKDGIIKIGDLGLSRRCPPGTSNRLPVYPAAGTKLYLAPEVISGAQNIDGEKVDIWACGVTLHYMLSGEYPFNIERGAQNYFVLLDLILKTPPKLAKCLNPCAKDLIGKILVKNPERRPNIVEILSHEWCRSSPKVHIPLDLSIFSSNRSDPEEMQKCEICYPGEYNIMARIYGHNVVRYVKKYHDIFLDADNKNSEK